MSEPNAKVWLVSTGEYEQYFIAAVFSTEEKARAWIVASGYGEVEEYDLDPAATVTRETPE